MFDVVFRFLKLQHTNFRWNYVTLGFHGSSERRGSGSLSWGPRPTWPRRCWGTRATTGPWTCGALGSSSTSHSRAHSPSMRTRTSMNRSKTHPSCIPLIHGRRFQRTRSRSSQTSYRWFVFILNDTNLMPGYFSGEAEEAVLSREGADPQLATRLPVLVRHEEAWGEK